MSKEITEPSNLFDEKGVLIQDGWARKPIINYNRDKVPCGWHRLKEWDNYVVVCPDHIFSVTVADVGYLGQISFNLIDLKSEKETSGGKMNFFTKGKMNLPTSSREGDIEIHEEEFDITIKKLEDKRIISLEYPTFGEKGLSGTLTCYQDPNKDSIVKVNRYKKKKKKFYYSDKIMWMPTEGILTFGDKKYEFKKENTYCRLDWGRGNWPYKIHWYWGGGAGKTEDGHDIWFSHGHSYEDPSLHDKNMVGYDGVGHKLGPIKFHLPDDLMDVWKFTSEDGRFEMTLEPIYIHEPNMNFVILSSKAIIVYGYYNGQVILDDGTKVKVKNILGHAERVSWKW